MLALRCKFAQECSPFENYLLVNPVSKLMIIGDCESGCEYISSLEYDYQIYRKWIISEFDQREKWIILNISDYASLGKGKRREVLTHKKLHYSMIN